MHKKARGAYRRHNAYQKHGLNDWITAVVDTKIKCPRDLLAKLFG
ncbi:hypothetical protein N8639_01600 [bacterium]|nr:hypothetical protein [bacterium]